VDIIDDRMWSEIENYSLLSRGTNLFIYSSVSIHLSIYSWNSKIFSCLSRNLIEWCFSRSWLHNKIFWRAFRKYQWLGTITDELNQNPQWWGPRNSNELLCQPQGINPFAVELQIYELLEIQAAIPTITNKYPVQLGSYSKNSLQQSGWLLGRTRLNPTLLPVFEFTLDLQPDL
jgi:hypothetical protein